jgi:hypothetical protein
MSHFESEVINLLGQIADDLRWLRRRAEEREGSSQCSSGWEIALTHSRFQDNLAMCG